MTTTKTLNKTTPRTASTDKPRPPAAKDAIAMLRADHAAVSAMFDEYDKSRSLPRKKALVAEIGMALSVHAQIEEEIFYPAVRAVLKDKLLVPEATVEHASVKDLIAKLDGLEPDGEMHDATMKVLFEYVKHHVQEEQNEMFPKVKSSTIDTVELGARMAARKEDLMARAA